jgi:hypothetical protein
MLLTFLSTWLFGLLCMSLDVVRIYSKATKIMDHILDLYLIEINDVISFMPENERKDFIAYAKKMNSERPGRMTYFLGSMPTMFLLWPISLINLLTTSKDYEMRFIAFMLSDIRLVLQKVHSFLCIKSILNNNETPLERVLEVDIEKLLSSLD